LLPTLRTLLLFAMTTLLLLKTYILSFPKATQVKIVILACR